MTFRQLISEVDANWKDKFRQKWSTKPIVKSQEYPIDTYRIVKTDNRIADSAGIQYVKTVTKSIQSILNELKANFNTSNVTKSGDYIWFIGAGSAEDNTNFTYIVFSSLSGWFKLLEDYKAWDGDIENKWFELINADPECSHDTTPF